MTTNLGDPPGLDDVDPDTRAALQRIIRWSRAAGPVPIVGTPDWLDAPWRTAVGGMAVCSLARLLEGTPTAVRQRLREDDLLAAVRCRHVAADVAALVPAMLRAADVDAARSDAQHRWPGTHPGYRRSA